MAPWGQGLQPLLHMTIRYVQRYREPIPIVADTNKNKSRGLPVAKIPARSRPGDRGVRKHIEESPGSIGQSAR